MENDPLVAIMTRNKHPVRASIGHHGDSTAVPFGIDIFKCPFVLFSSMPVLCILPVLGPRSPMPVDTSDSNESATHLLVDL